MAEGSFRDPQGKITYKDGRLVREIYPPFDDYNYFMSGLYGGLISEGLIIPHHEIEVSRTKIVIKPELIPFISYPYEWPFSYLKEAALATLKIARIALDRGMMLKDASAFNIQKRGDKFLLIDTLSFVKYQSGMPWIAYTQFIQHFLAPLYYAKYHGQNNIGIEGANIGQTWNSLPLSGRCASGPLLHLYLQSRKVSGVGKEKPKVGINQIYALLDSLEGTVFKLQRTCKSDWSSYESCSYSEIGRADKLEKMAQLFQHLTPGTVCDIGANTGYFTRLAMEFGHKVIALEKDYDTADKLSQRFPSMMCLVQDICNPSPAIGWANTERKSMLSRLYPDTIMMLAVIHHICLGNNIPLEMLAELLSQHCKNLIIEFVPPEDTKARIVAGDKTHPVYDLPAFKSAFSRYFDITLEEGIQDSCRSLYLMRSKNP